jgi:tripartite-type tricarboxylate transporter receptor subunit TctC
MGLFVLTAGVAVSAAQQQSRVTQVIVPFGPGGSGDIIMRLMAQYLGEKRNQTVVVETKPGANGIIGMQAALNAPADGNTWVVASTSTFAANPSLFKRLPYDVDKDFSLVGVLNAGGAYMLVRPEAPYRSVADLVAFAKASKEQMTYGYFNASSQVPGAILGKMAGITMVPVPYKQISNAIADLMSGQIHVIFADTVAGDSYVASGTLRALAVTSAKRLKKHPDLPALAETYPDFVTEGLIGVAVRSGTPQQDKLRINQLFNEAMGFPAVRARIEDMGFSPTFMSVEECESLARSQRQRWKEYVSLAGIEPQ